LRCGLLRVGAACVGQDSWRNGRGSLERCADVAGAVFRDHRFRPAVVGKTETAARVEGLTRLRPPAREVLRPPDRYGKISVTYLIYLAPK
jgi:hypothetical protein